MGEQRSHPLHIFSSISTSAKKSKRIASVMNGLRACSRDYEMPVLAGFHVEGNDHLILHALVSKVLLMPENEIQVDFVDAPGRGWQFVLEFIPRALKRFYALCAQFAVIGADIDGNVDLVRPGLTEEPRHPRHGNHVCSAAGDSPPSMLAAAVASILARLN